MADVSALSCVSCGAPLEPAPGRTIRCPYCDRVLTVSGTTLHVEPGRERRTEADELLAGYREDVGQGRRLAASELRPEEWQAEVDGLWPTGASSSSSFGPGWDTDAIVGPPTVFPRCGDISGAWAPRPKTSHVEWLQAFFPEGAPAVDRVRVFETCAPGAVFAVTVTEPGDDGLGERCVWQRRPAALRGAHMLEVPVDPPRHLASVKVYLTNHDASQWSEIDSIGLMAISPVPASMRARPRVSQPPQQRLPRRIRRRGSFAALAGAAMLLALVLIRWGRPSPVASIERSAPTERIEGVESIVATPGVGELDGIAWANLARGASSQFSSSGWSHAQALGAPDVYPAHGDDQRAWASLLPDAGPEWIEVAFDPPRQAVAIVVVETFNPGALVRVDDVTEPAHPVLLWAGETPKAGSSRVLRLELPAPRRVGAVRLVLDTRGSKQWNEIDAVGLVPAR